MVVVVDLAVFGPLALRTPDALRVDPDLPEALRRRVLEAAWLVEPFLAVVIADANRRVVQQNV